MIPDMNQITIERAAMLTGNSTQTVRRRIKSGVWPAELIAGRWSIDAEAAGIDTTPEPAAEILPMLSTINDLANRLADSEAARGRAEAINEHLRERLAELRDTVQM